MFLRRLGLVAVSSSVVIACACSPAIPVSIVDGTAHIRATYHGGSLAQLLAENHISLGTHDRLLQDGRTMELSSTPGTQSAIVLQIQRAHNIELLGSSVMTFAVNVGEALTEAGIRYAPGDYVSPALDNRLLDGMSINYLAGREFTVLADGKETRIRSAGASVAEVLADAHLPLLGLDRSIPPAADPAPADGQIRIVRISESVSTITQTVPFDTTYLDSVEMALGESKILQAGAAGVATTKTRVRFEDGTEVTRWNESLVEVIAPVSEVRIRGTKIVEKTASVGGVTLQFWHKMPMYATWYSPCNSGSDKCSYGTASGQRAGRGVVAVDPGLYDYLQGQRIYVEGYGYAVIGDVGGGYIVEQRIGVSRYKWIDLGFDDNNITDMTGWVTVYFLAPAPASIPPVLQ